MDVGGEQVFDRKQFLSPDEGDNALMSRGFGHQSELVAGVLADADAGLAKCSNEALESEVFSLAGDDNVVKTAPAGLESLFDRVNSVQHFHKGQCRRFGVGRLTKRSAPLCRLKRLPLIGLVLNGILWQIGTDMSPKNAKTFTAVLEPLQNGLGWVVAWVPFDVRKTWTALKGTRVRGEIEGVALRTSLMAYGGGGGHFLLVNRKMQAATGARVGSRVRIVLEPDLEERAAVVPTELAQALKGDRRLRRWFDGLATSMRRDVGKWVMEPKSDPSRRNRAEKVAEWMMLTMEGELDAAHPPPILKAAFLRQPLAEVGWQAMTLAQRRRHLLGIFHMQGPEARERRAAKAFDDALRMGRKAKGQMDAVELVEEQNR
jgi:uncharacterized protein YdeI (YjbR/CyaY-like superfamily)